MEILKERFPDKKIGCYHDTNIVENAIQIYKENNKYCKTGDVITPGEAVNEMDTLREKVYQQLTNEYDLLIFDRSFLSTLVYQHDDVVVDYEIGFQEVIYEYLGRYHTLFDKLGCSYLYYVQMRNETPTTNDKRYEYILRCLPRQCWSQIVWKPSKKQEIAETLVDLMSVMLRTGVDIDVQT